MNTIMRTLLFKKKSKRIKGGNDHHHENAEHQILATRIYLIYMSVKYDFHRKNTVTLNHILAPNLNVQSCRQHQERKNLQSPPLEYADLPCPGCCTDSPSCPSPSPHPESYISNIPIFIIHKSNNQIFTKLSNTFPHCQPTLGVTIQTSIDSKFKYF